MREFSEESRQHFDDLIDEVNDSDWCAFTDFFGDLQYNYGGVNMPYSLAEKAGVADDYWTDVIDANNTEKSEIDEIFETVKGIDKDYESKFTQYIETVTVQIDIIKSLDEIVKPELGNFTTEKIGVVSKEIIEIYINRAKKDDADGEYDYEYIKEFFYRDPELISEYEYYAMILIFNDMEYEEQEKFVKAAYMSQSDYYKIFCKDDDFFIDSTVEPSYWLSDSYIKMMEYYSDIVNDIDQSSLKPDSPYYEKTINTVNNYSILTVFNECSPTVYLNGGEFDIKIYEIKTSDINKTRVQIFGGKDNSRNSITQTYTIHRMTKCQWSIPEAMKNKLNNRMTDSSDIVIEDGVV